MVRAEKIKESIAAQDAAKAISESKREATHPDKKVLSDGLHSLEGGPKHLNVYSVVGVL